MFYKFFNWRILKINNENVNIIRESTISSQKQIVNFEYGLFSLVCGWGLNNSTPNKKMHII